jgi:hypothetical protein
MFGGEVMEKQEANRERMYDILFVDGRRYFIMIDQKDKDQQVLTACATGNNSFSTLNECVAIPYTEDHESAKRDLTIKIKELHLEK